MHLCWHDNFLCAYLLPNLHGYIIGTYLTLVFDEFNLIFDGQHDCGVWGYLLFLITWVNWLQWIPTTKVEYTYAFMELFTTATGYCSDIGFYFKNTFEKKNSGKIPADDILKYFSYFYFQKIAFDISCKLSLDNLHEMSNAFFWGEISVCRCLLN